MSSLDGQHQVKNGSCSQITPLQCLAVPQKRAGIEQALLAFGDAQFILKSTFQLING